MAFERFKFIGSSPATGMSVCASESGMFRVEKQRTASMNHLSVRMIHPEPPVNRFADRALQLPERETESLQSPQVTTVAHVQQPPDGPNRAGSRYCRLNTVQAILSTHVGQPDSVDATTGRTIATTVVCSRKHRCITGTCFHRVASSEHAFQKINDGVANRKLKLRNRSADATASYQIVQLYAVLINDRQHSSASGIAEVSVHRD